MRNGSKRSWLFPPSVATRETAVAARGRMRRCRSPRDRMSHRSSSRIRESSSRRSRMSALISANAKESSMDGLCIAGAAGHLALPTIMPGRQPRLSVVNRSRDRTAASGSSSHMCTERECCRSSVVPFVCERLARLAPPSSFGTHGGLDLLEALFLLQPPGGGRDPLAESPGRITHVGPLLRA